MSKMTTTEWLARMDERQKATTEKLDEILNEVRKTNGRVTELEGWRAEIRGSFRTTVFLTSVISSIIGGAVGISIQIMF